MESYRAVSDADIDYSDIPKLTSDQLKGARRARVGRPSLGPLPRKLISIKIDPFLLERLKQTAKKQGTRYQSLIHSILERYISETSK